MIMLEKAGVSGKTTSLSEVVSTFIACLVPYQNLTSGKRQRAVSCKAPDYSTIGAVPATVKSRDRISSVIARDVIRLFHSKPRGRVLAEHIKKSSRSCEEFALLLAANCRKTRLITLVSQFLAASSITRVR